MSEDDPRHGKDRGYIAGCREACCRRAHAKARKDRRTRMYLARVDRLRKDGTGTRRRIQALMALGWSTRQLDKMLGRRPSYTYRILSSHGDVYLTTATMFADLYERLSMTCPTADTAEERGVIRRNANLAARRGYAPPLAWDDIDNDPAPHGAGFRPGTWSGHGGQQATDIDEVVVARLLAGQPTPSTRHEKDEAMRRWKAKGGSERSLCALHGWKDSRYGREGAVA